MNMRPRSLIANIVSGSLTAMIVIGLGYFIYEKHDSFSLFAPASKIESNISGAQKPVASERIDEEQVENEMNRIAEEKRKVEEKRKAEEARKKAEAEAKRKAEEARKKAEAEKKRLAELEAKKKAEAAEQKRLEEIALKKKQAEDKKKAEEAEKKRQADEIEKKRQAEADKKRIEEEKKAKAAAEKKAAEEKRAKEVAAAKAKAEAEARATAEGLSALNDASYQSMLAAAFRDQWNIGMDAIGYTAVVAIRVDKTGKILEIVESQSSWSGNDAFDSNVRSTVWRVGRVPVPQNKNGVEQLAKQVLLINFDPKDQGLSYY
ncbi:cell envelope integrity protein TolA [Wohlfahrtiimonas larvae]|uniref:Protein TolA n=1 Tax=Wohlfahrtiimonas larvae TaxID=1157986 RepID=A0ABP9MU10_9GAMM|nr:cell envelope integrity protein TolA [Wohlfahrtiimonas larvae]